MSRMIKKTDIEISTVNQRRFFDLSMVSAPLNP